MSMNYIGSLPVELMLVGGNLTAQYTVINGTSGLSSSYSTIDFASDIPIKLTLQWSAAHASTYYRIAQATAYKLNS